MLRTFGNCGRGWYRDPFRTYSGNSSSTGRVPLTGTATCSLFAITRKQLGHLLTSEWLIVRANDLMDIQSMLEVTMEEKSTVEIDTDSVIGEFEEKEIFAKIELPADKSFSRSAYQSKNTLQRSSSAQ